MRVLVVDDNQDHRFLTKRALAPLHVDVVTASDGEQALDWALGRRGRGPAPDFVLLDVKLPGMDGFDVLKRLRAEASTSRLPVVMFTSSENAADQRRAKELGADGFLTKPLDAASFTALVRATVGEWARKAAGQA